MGLLDASAGRETDCDPTGVGDTGSAEDRGADALGVRVSLADPDTLTADDREGGTLVLGVDAELGVPLGLSLRVKEAPWVDDREPDALGEPC